MTDNLTKSPLLPDRTAQSELFICDIFDAVPKGDIASMEHPIFSLATKPDLKPREYISPDNKKFINITPSVKGMATVHDRDILIFCVSQIIAALNEGRTVSKRVCFHAHDFLKATNRMTNGQAYEALRAALIRLRGTTIETNIETGGTSTTRIFGLVDDAQVIRETHDGRMQEIEVTLSEWVFRAIESYEVLTLHRDYFRLRKPLERRIYDIARKHCGNKLEWRISLEKLRQKSGSNSTPKEFRRLISNIVTADQEHSHIPDYAVELNDNDMVLFRNRGTLPGNKAPSIETQSSNSLSPDVYERARKVAPGWDIYVLENEWRSWLSDIGAEPPKNPDHAFIGFCKSRYRKHGKPA